MSKVEKIPWEQALDLYQRFVKFWKAPGDLECAGSVRREKPMVGDLDIVVTLQDPLQMLQAKAWLMTLWGPLKSKKKEPCKGGLFCDRPVEVHLALPESAGACLLHATGSWEWNVYMRVTAKALGYKLNRYGLWLRDTEHRIAGASEAEIFEWLEMDFVAPEDRSENPW